MVLQQSQPNQTTTSSTNNNINNTSTKNTQNEVQKGLIPANSSSSNLTSMHVLPNSAPATNNIAPNVHHTMNNISTDLSHHHELQSQIYAQQHALHLLQLNNNAHMSHAYLFDSSQNNTVVPNIGSSQQLLPSVDSNNTNNNNNTHNIMYLQQQQHQQHLQQQQAQHQLHSQGAVPVTGSQQATSGTQGESSDSDSEQD